MGKHYSTDNECLLTGGLWALIAAAVVALFSWIFFHFWPTVIIIFVVAFVIAFAIAVFMCKTRTVGRGGVDMRAVDLARAEMGLAEPNDMAPEAEANEKAEAEAAAKAKAAVDAKAEAKQKAAEEKAAAEKAAEAKVVAEEKAAAKASVAKEKAAAKAQADKAKAAKEKAAKKAEVEAAAHDDHEVSEEEAKPELLTEARGGQADDLKSIKGIGPKLEKELNAAGVFHFDQIANWSAEEEHWADYHLVSFKGRVSRDKWVDQAKELLKS